MTTYQAVKAQITKLEKQAADLYKKEVAGVVAKIQALMAEYGLTAADLGKKSRAPKARKAAAAANKTKAATKTTGTPKYRDPISSKTWTGKGKPPTWMAEAVKKGQSKDDFLIGKKTSAAKMPAAKTAKKKPATAKAAAKTPAKATKTTKAQKVTPATKAAKTPVARKPAAKKPAAKKAAAAKPAKAAARKSATKKPAAAPTATPAPADKT